MLETDWNRHRKRRFRGRRPLLDRKLERRFICRNRVEPELRPRLDRKLKWRFIGRNRVEPELV